ncbi:MAG: hypothetical protein IJ574_04045 [Bacilli bacterium]|nr:hypothetical protein [Bacilli bacterium]
MNFLKKYDFNKQDIEELLNNSPLILTQEIEKHSKLVSKNIEYLKDLGVSNYRDIFKKYYDMFLMDNSNFIEVFAKYDRDDLIEKLEKNMAIIEFL